MIYQLYNIELDPKNTITPEVKNHGRKQREAENQPRNPDAFRGSHQEQVHEAV